jgi:hypothetical protein
MFSLASLLPGSGVRIGPIEFEGAVYEVLVAFHDSVTESIVCKLNASTGARTGQII